MIIQCKNCNKRFEVPDSAIPNEGRKVQCGNCGTKWMQVPIEIEKKDDPVKKKQEEKKDIVMEKKEIDPSSSLVVKKVKKTKKQVKVKESNNSNLGFFGYIIVLLILITTLVGVLETFKESISYYWPSINDQLGFIYESLNNIIIIIKELFNKY